MNWKNMTKISLITMRTARKGYFLKFPAVYRWVVCIFMSCEHFLPRRWRQRRKTVASSHSMVFYFFNTLLSQTGDESLHLVVLYCWNETDNVCHRIAPNSHSYYSHDRFPSSCQLKKGGKNTFEHQSCIKFKRNENIRYFGSLVFILF